MARTGRPLAMPIQDRKEAIYAAAEKLFGQLGYTAVTMSDIAAAAGMSKRTLYLVFADKEKLLRSLVASSYVWSEAEFDVSSKNAVAELKLRLRVIAKHVLSERHINLCRLAIGESVGFEGLADTFLEDGIKKSRRSLLQTLEKIEQRQRTVKLPLSVLADMLFGAACGRTLMIALLRGNKPVLGKVYKTIDELIDGLFVE